MCYMYSLPCREVFLITRVSNGIKGAKRWDFTQQFGIFIKPSSRSGGWLGSALTTSVYLLRLPIENPNRK